MTVFFKVDFTCKTCGAEITYENEVPKIYTDRANLIENNRAERWIAAHKNDERPADTPHNISVKTLVLRFYYEADLLSIKYVVCPVCGERIYI